MSSEQGRHPKGQAGWLGLAGIVVFAFSFPVYFVASYWLDWASTFVFAVMLAAAFVLVRMGLRRSK